MESRVNIMSLIEGAELYEEANMKDFSRDEVKETSRWLMNKMSDNGRCFPCRDH